MKYELNGEQAATDAKCIERLIAELGLLDSKIATAVNGEFVPRTEWASTALHEGDRVEVLAPMVGG